MSVRVGTLRINLAVDLNAFQKGLRSAERQLDKASDGFEKIGNKLTAAITLPLAAVGGVAAKMTADFDHSLSRINGLLGASDGTVAAYRQGILGLAGATAKAPLELAEAMNTVVDAGYTGAAALDVLRAAAKGATAGLGETKEIADAVTTAMKVYRRDNLSAAAATGILIAAGREGRATLRELMPALGAIGPVANELGVSFRDVNAALAAVSDQGMSATEAGTALRAVFLTLLKPTTEAQQALADVGLSAEGLRRQVREQGLLSVMQSLQGAFAGNEAALTRVFPGAKTLGGVLTLLGTNAGAAQQAFTALATAGVGDLDRAFSAAERTVRVQWDRAMAQLQVTAIEVGTVLMQVVLPALNLLNGALQRGAAYLNGLSQDQKNLALVVGLLAAAAGPAALAMGLLFKVLAGGVAILRTSVMLFTALAGVVSAPMLAAAAIVAVAAAVIVNRWQAIKEGVQVILNWIADMVPSVFKTAMGDVVDAVSRVASWLQPFGTAVTDFVRAPVAAAAAEMQSAGEKMLSGLGGALDGVTTKMGAMATGLLTSVNAALPIVTTQIEATRVQTDGLAAAQVALAEQAPTVWEQLGAAMDAGYDSLHGTMTALRQQMADTGEAMQSQMRSMASESARSMGAMTAAFFKGKMDLAKFIDEMIQAIVKLIAKILILRALTAVGMGGPFAAGFIGGMFADGGRPPVGRVSVVGEEGPELFVPDVAGTVIPNHKLGGGGTGGGGTVIEHLEVNVQGSSDPRATAEAVVDVLNERYIAPSSKDVTLARRMSRANSRNSERSA